MASKVVFEVQVSDKGSLKVVQKDLEKVATGVERVGTKHKTAAKDADTFFDTQKKGVIGTANSTKSFSKLAETINSGGSSGVVGAYATLAANIFAVTAAFGALSRAAQVDQVIAGLDAMGNRMGVTLNVVAKNLREITGYALSSEQAFRSTAQVASSGLGADAVEKLGRVATDTSFALGRNLTDSMDRLTRGVVKLEPELLDELGLMTKLGESTTKYANAIGKSESQISNFEKRQAFLNAIVAEGEAKFGGLSTAAGNTKNLDVLGATFADLTQDILSFINSGALPLAGIFSNKGFLLAGMLLFASTIRKQLLPGLNDLAQKAAASSQSLLDMANKQALAVQKVAAGPRGASTKGFSSLVSTLQQGMAPTQEALEKGLSSVDKAIKKYEASAENLANKARPLTSKEFDKLENDGRKLANLDAQRKAVLDIMELRDKAATRQAAADAIGAASTAKYMTSIKLLGTAMTLYNAEQMAATKGAGALAVSWSALKTAGYSAALAARVFGAALLSAIPLIGQAVLVLTVLWEGLKYLYDLWQGEDVKKFNAAMEEQADIAKNLSARVDELNRIKKTGLSLGAQEVSSSQIIANTLRENIDAYTKSAAAQEKAYAKKSNLKIGDTAEFQLLKKLRESELPGVEKAVDDALGSQGLQGALKNANTEIKKSDLPKYAKAVDALSKGPLLAYGDAVKDLSDNFKTAEDALNAFNKNMIPSTPYDEVVKQLDGVTNAFSRLIVSASQTGDFGAGVAKSFSNIASTNPALTRFLTPETQQMLKEYAEVNNKITTANEKDAAVLRVRSKELQNGLVFASSELYVIQEKFQLGQQLVRQAAAETELMQARLQKLNSYTALSGQDIKKRRAAENAIIGLQIQQLKAQKDLIESQLVMLKLTNDLNQTLLTQAAIRANITTEINKGAKASASDIMMQSTKALSELTIQRESLARDKDPANNGRIQQLDAQIKKTNELITLSTNAASSEANLRDGQAQVNALNTKIAAEAMKATSARVIAAEAAAQDAKTESQLQDSIVQKLAEQNKLEDALFNIRTKSSGEIENAAEAYALLFKHVKETAEAEKLSAQKATASAIADLTYERTKAEEQGGTQTVAILDRQIAQQRDLLAIKLQQIDAAAQLQILDKIAIDNMKSMEMQRQNLSYLERELETRKEGLDLQRQSAILDAEIYRKSRGFANNDFFDKANEIRVAADAYKYAVQESELKKAIIDLEYDLLEAQRKQTYNDMASKKAAMEEQLAIAKSNGSPQSLIEGLTKQVDSYTKIVAGLDKGEGAIAEARANAKTNVEDAISNARKALESASIRRPERETARSRLEGRYEAQRARDEAARTLGEQVLVQSITKLDGTIQAANDNEVTVTGQKTRLSARDKADFFADQTMSGDNSMLAVFQNMADQLGPQGNIIPAILSGINSITDATMNLMDTLSDPNSSFSDKFTAIGEVALQAISTISSVLNSATQQKIANIDSEIAAEQKRDGKSAESVAKIEALEKKKDAAARKQFNVNKKLMMAQAVISTATAVTGALASSAILGPFVATAMAAMIGALGAAQLAIIAGTSYQSASSASGSNPATASSLTIGSRGNGAVDLAKSNNNLGGELGFVRGQSGYGSNSSNYQLVGSAYGGSNQRGYGNRAFLVGEKGPEIAEPDVPVTYRPANDNDRGQQPLHAEFHINALDSKGVAEMLDEQKGNIISMLRGAANASGQRFLEDVDVNVYTRPNVSRL